jgi:hypothetical protein
LTHTLIEKQYCCVIINIMEKAFGLNIFLFELPLAFLKFVLNITKVSFLHDDIKPGDIMLDASVYQPMQRCCLTIFAAQPIAGGFLSPLLAMSN